jgi:FlgD Ig-like domain
LVDFYTILNLQANKKINFGGIKMKRISLFLVLIFILLLELPAQTLKVKGSVSTATQPVKNALITFTDEKDTTRKYSSLTDSLGNYNIGLITSVNNTAIIPAKFELEQNYPNPFTNTTAISYKLNKQYNVHVTIYDILGREIKNYNIGEQFAGVHGMLWDGSNNFGEKVATGIYFCRLQADKESRINKMVLIRGTGISTNLPLSGNSISTEKLNKITTAKINSESYTVQITNTQNTAPKIAAMQTNISVGQDTTINFTVNNAPAAYAWTFCQGLPNNLPVTGFAASGNNLVAATYDLYWTYILISFDNGASWAVDTSFHLLNKAPYSQLWTGTPVTFLNFGGYLFAGMSAFKGALYRSSDNGMTWSDKGIMWPGSDSSNSYNIRCFSTIGTNIFAGTDQGVFKSTDNGLSWIPINNGLIDPVYGEGYPVIGLTVVGSDIFASIGIDEIFRSTNGGGIWEKVNITDYHYNALATVGTSVFAGAFSNGDPSTGGVFISKDEGNSWSHTDAGLGTDHYVNIIYSDGYYLFAGTNTSLFVSNDAGTTWNNISAGSIIDSTYIETIAVINSQLFVGVYRGGGWRLPISTLPAIIENKKNRYSR